MTGSKKSQQQPVPKAPRPITPIRGSSYLPPKQLPAIPKTMKPKKTPRKEVRRELVPGYDSIGAFLISVKDYTIQEFMVTTPGYRDVPCFQEFVAVDGIEVLRDVFKRLNKEFQDRNEIHWFLSSRWEERFHERHIFLIACGIWNFILQHCKDIEEDNGGATHHQEAETGEAVRRADKNEEQGAEKTATNGAKEFDPRELEKGPRGKLIGIALSGYRSGIEVRKIVARMGKTKAPCSSTTYETFKDWHREKPQLFYNFLFRLRKEGEEWEKARGQIIPDNYYESYQ